MDDTRATIRTFNRDTCFLCGYAGNLLYSDLGNSGIRQSGNWSIRECPRCGTLWLDPCPISEDVQLLYPDTYYTHSVPPIAPDRSHSRVRALVRKNRLLRQAVVLVLQQNARLLQETPTFWDLVWLKPGCQGRLLDVGCGNGQFLALMQTIGWQVSGVEPDTNAARVATEVYSLPITTSTLETSAFPTNYFDVIVMNQVVEHLVDPLMTLAKCHQLLRSGGRLVIFTPNAASFAHRHIFHASWVPLDPPRHLCLFSPLSLCRAMEISGFRVRSVMSSIDNGSAGWSPSVRAQRSRAGFTHTLRQSARDFLATSLVYAGVRVGNTVWKLGDNLGVIGVKP